MTTTTLTELTKALRDVAATVVKDGALDAAGVMLPAFLDQDKAALKDKVRQSLVLLKDGKGYGVVGPWNHDSQLSMCVGGQGGADGTQHDTGRRGQHRTGTLWRDGSVAVRLRRASMRPCHSVGL